MKICFYQLFKGFKVVREGWGDCSICVPNGKNQDCKGYWPISIWYFTAKEEK